MVLNLSFYHPPPNVKCLNVYVCTLTCSVVHSYVAQALPPSDVLCTQKESYTMFVVIVLIL